MVTTYQMKSLSTLELMLEELQQEDEETNDLPPPLPVRPVIKARLPKGRRKLTPFGKEKRNLKDIRAQKMHLLINGRDGAELSRVLQIQRCFRGYQARQYYHELKTGAVALQSFVRGEIERKYFQGLTRRLAAIIFIQKHIKKHHHKRTERQQTAAICLQSGKIVECLIQNFEDSPQLFSMHSAVIRGWLTRKKSNLSGDEKRSCVQNIREKNDLDNKEPETKVPRSVLLDLQRHILKTEAALERKKEENAALRLHIQHYEIKWNQYESKMKAMEKMWQDQLTSIQISLAAEREKKGDEKTKGKLRLLILQDQDENVHNGFPRTISLRTSALNHPGEQPSGRSNPKNKCNNHHVMDMVNHYQNFVVHDQCNSGEEGSVLRPNDELQKLKIRFEAWKKDCKNKLREAKATMKQLGHSERGKGSKIWCGR
ncbi:hypothetical protein H5410_007903 [Solanum commersonii]|uniref:Myosin heavy chain n=1 Tax=Solanum commersonii TaxID=4109 RepID=A0A9J6ADF1_SOLCO|nr:hypothetical protein H5410_007903 [Solanum commersonii]